MEITETDPGKFQPRETAAATLTDSRRFCKTTPASLPRNRLLPKSSRLRIVTPMKLQAGSAPILRDPYDLWGEATMRKWWKTLGVLAGGLVSLGGLVTSASGQFPPPGGNMQGPPGMMPGMGMGMPPGMAPGMMTSGGGMAPGAFTNNHNQYLRPAEFPNPAVPSPEPASPFSIKDEGFGGAFTELNDPHPRMAPCYTMVLRGEYVGWWVKRERTTANLVTTNSNPFNEVGALNEPHTQILVPAGEGTIDYGRLNGFRATLGLAFGFAPPIEVTGLSFNRNYTVFGEGTPNATGRLLSRPVQVLNIANGPNAGLETAETVTIPNVLNGSVSIVSRFSLWSLEVNTFLNFIETDAMKVDLLLGYRHADLYESLDINSRSGGFTGRVIFGGVQQPAGFSTFVHDNFRTRNAFDGGQGGFRTVITFDRLSFFADAKLALGNTYHTLTIDGTTTLNQGPNDRPTTTLPGGLLALPSNTGFESRSQFSVISEGTFSVSYQLTPHVRVFGGYDIFYWSSVARPGDHLSGVIDARQVPTATIFNGSVGAAPGMPSIIMRDFWAQGFHVGVEIGF
jgi:hypothetical protein